MTADNIVMVDDDPYFLEAQREVLEHAGYCVACFSEPHGALEAMRRNKPALVVTDLMMTRLAEGFDLARTVKEDPALSDVPVIIVTAIASRRGFNLRPRSAADLASMHADAYFEKPVSPAVLLAKVAELLTGRRNRVNHKCRTAGAGSD